jgi:hypothetical protein
MAQALEAQDLCSIDRIISSLGKNQFGPRGIPTGGADTFSVTPVFSSPEKSLKLRSKIIDGLEQATS